MRRAVALADVFHLDKQGIEINRLFFPLESSGACSSK